MFAASFDSKMGCLYSFFDAKKQGKPAWVVRTRNWKLRGGENRLSGLLEGVSRGEGKEARGIEYIICSIHVMVVALRYVGRLTFLHALCSVVGVCDNMSYLLLDGCMVVYRSWIFGFDSGIPRVTISGRFCDWTGSRGLHLLLSEPGYAIIGTVSEAPIAYTTIENVVLVKQLEQLDPCPC
ncbi:hypothetical protein GQ457_16G014320 [Hibiscus cannabinus]